MRINSLLVVGALIWTLQAAAFQDKSYIIAWAPTFENMLNKVTTEDSGKPSTLGNLNIGLTQIAATFQLGFDGGFYQPFLAFSLIPRKNSTGDISETLVIPGFKYGSNFTSMSWDGGWDWSVGIGIWRSTIKGNGATYTDGSGTAFPVPSGGASTQEIFTSGGVGYETENLRFADDLFVLNILNSKKRSYNMMLTIAWKGHWL